MSAFSDRAKSHPAAAQNGEKYSVFHKKL